MCKRREQGEDSGDEENVQAICGGLRDASNREIRGGGFRTKRSVVCYRFWD